MQVITDPVTGRSKGYGFVRFGSESERDRALGEMAGHLISNRPIRVSIATAKKNTATASPAPAAATGGPLCMAPSPRSWSRIADVRVWAARGTGGGSRALP